MLFEDQIFPLHYSTANQTKVMHQSSTNLRSGCSSLARLWCLMQIGS